MKLATSTRGSRAGRHWSGEEGPRWRRWMSVGAALALSLGLVVAVVAPSQAADPCATGGNPIACENSQPGNDPSEWEIVGDGDSSIEGFTTDISVNAGQTVNFKVHAEADYTMDVYRMGYYGGKGAKFKASLTPNQSVSKANQPATCVNKSADTGLIDCGPWGITASWAVPSNAVSGIYFAHIVRKDNGLDNHVMFVVRNDSSHSDMVFQTSDTTWQAYNTWGGNSLYQGEPVGRAYKVSYNRPFSTRATPGGRDFVWSNEYPMVRFMEANGYDVSYISGIDTDRAGSLLLNHKTFLSVGHDEYWSGQQRANVEAARDAGVNLAFFSGNEVYWKTRYENSVDGANTPYRTLVTYKESTDGLKLDPTSTWTGTWRDPRFSPPADGGRPENSLTGTIFTVNRGTNAIKVPAADGKMRFWRNTAAASLAAGATYTTPTGTLGYEWDEDLDNGFRPAGSIKMSNATWDVPEKMVPDYGSNVAPGTATHSLTLYRAPSGALVFGAGTVQWTWGLDAEHDGDATPTDPAMRQATVNLFADMGAQPTTIQSGLTAAAKSTDTTPATAVITSPAAGASLANGSSVTVSGTATDVGGQVGGVEVSLDGGTTWHPATGRASWSYTGILTGAGATSIQARASDDSANLQVVPTQRAVTVACPCTMFKGETPVTASENDTSDIELGVKFKPQRDGFITGVTFYKGAKNTGTHTGTLWSADGTQLATGTFVSETATGWQTMQFAKAVRVTANTTYVASYHAPVGGYASTGQYFVATDITQPPLMAPKATQTDGNGVFDTGPSKFPTSTFKGGNYFVSPVFDTVEPPDTTPPAVVSSDPILGASSVPTTAKPSITFSEPIKAGTLTLQVSGPAGLVSGTTALNADRTVATFTPAAALAAGTTYTFKTSGGTDDAGNALAMTTTTFKTATSSEPGVCPCSIWPDSTVPTQVTVNDSSQVELGVRFKADQDGFVSGIRFYKGPQNVGTHTSTLWGADGTQLATATFGTETTTGWQEVRFATKVAVTAGTVYTASYNTAGKYSATPNALSQQVTSSPLIAPRDGDGGGNGVYRYGTRAYPSTSGGGTSYGVDVVFELPPDVTPPGISAIRPGADSTNNRTDAPITASFNEKVISGLTATVKANGTTVASTVSLDTAGRIATVAVTGGLQADTNYSVSLNGAKDAAGNSMTAAYTWTFKTSGPNSSPSTLYPSDYTPAVTSANDSSALELGVRFTPSVNGFVTGVRFYKGAGNTGTHTGSLWNSAGALMTTATFTNESASGWQTVTFAAPVAVSSGTTYTASYSAPVGHYAADAQQFTSDWTNGVLTAPAAGGNGVYSTTVGRVPRDSYQATGYGVDVVLTTGNSNDTVPPSLVSTNPVNNATSVAPSLAPVATFDEALAASSVTASITGPGGTVVPSTVSVGADSTVTVTPNATLAYLTTYQVSISGSDLAGNAMATAARWSFQTARQATTACPCSLWPDESAPAVLSDSDTRAIELGVKFSPSSNGYVTGVRFYKGPQNTGTHVGTLWSSTGGELAKATFSAESAAGWQEVSFSSPVAVTAGTTYVASYHTDAGGFSATSGGFANAAVTRGPLTAPIGTATDPNGVYVYGARAFPTAGTNTNYWVDVLFDTAVAADTTPPSVTTVAPAASATSTAATAPADAVFSEAVDPASVVMTLKNGGGTAVAGATTYDATTRTARFTPSSPLAENTSYTATATATDLAGNAMAAPRSWSFTTGDATPPTVSSRLPGVDATNVAATGTVVSGVFSEPINTASLQFTLKNGATAIAGAVAYDATTRKATFTPSAALPQAATLTASLLAADTAGNIMTSASTWSFTTQDTTPPAVNAVTATGSGTTATIAWTTDEASSSVVAYGTSATSLTFSKSVPGNGTAHSVPLTGLTANTRYYYRVTSADASGNSTTSPATSAAAAQYAPAVTPFVQSSTASFTPGAVSGTYVSDRSGGGVTLAPAATQEFPGTTVPSTWAISGTATGGSVTVANGAATISGRLFRSTSTFTNTREVDFVATLKPVNGQWIGATDDDFNGTTDRWVAFRTTSTGGLVAETVNGTAGTTSTNLSSTLLGGSHRWEIDWTGSATIYKVDGTTVATHTRGITASMRVAVLDNTQDANPVVVDSVWISPYSASGTFTSTVIDAGASVGWRALTPTTTIPSGTTITYQVRTGPNATAGGTGWTAFATVAAGANINVNARYLQYRATLTTNSTRNTAPLLSAVSLAFAVL